MKLSSRHIIPLMLVCVMLTGLFSSCQRKPLYLAQRGTLDINVSVYDIQLELLWGVSWKTDWQYLWDESLYGYIGYTEPSGVRANVYTVNEDYHRSKYTTRNFSTNGGRVSLTTNNTYDMMFHNNDTEYILYATDDSTYYYATTRSNTRSSYTRSHSTITNHNQPDQLFGTYIHDLYVSDDPDEYTVEEDEDGYLVYVYNVNAELTPYTMIYLFQVMILNNYDEVGQRITGAEGITASGMAGGVDLFNRLNDSTRIVAITQDDIKPIQDNRELTLPDGQKVVGDIFAARMMTWGLPGINPLDHINNKENIQLYDSIYGGIGLQLRNGTIYPVQQNISEQMLEHPSGGVITLVIDAAAIPDSIIGGKPQPGGGFDASVDGWDNEINTDIII